ncbi:hypothetical protein E4U17_007936 [Claviceps sp. LM77 group G4]|nr:hypothetical protein E4U17_007936 [Claviceps sp. LM77 group G4]KAG6073799.1 hypothetical protein E4U16_004416 [Claviceps sp. LM84 group G4]KAG6079759.1 hypothetical protein E4U33_008147 [Claviceps sp. LM78 group G4]
MVANTEKKAGSGQMASQQPQRSSATVPLHLRVYQKLLDDSQTTPNSMAWQLGTNFTERMGQTMNLISSMTMAMHGIDHAGAAEFGCSFEREVFHNAPSKEVYDHAMANKTLEFYKKRQETELYIQSTGGAPSAANSTS